MLDAGSVVATLGGKFNPAGFRSYDGAMKKAIGSATAAESAMVKSAERSAAATAALGATAEKASAAVTAASIKARQAALAVERAQLASASATEKYGAASVQARQAALGLTAAQQRLAVASNELAAAQGRAASANAALTTGTGKSSAAVSALGRASKTGAAVGLAVLAYGLIKSVGAASNFEQAMADVHAVTKANSRDMKLMSNAALDLGAKTGVGATKAAGALAELAKGGLSTKQTIGALKGTIAMSQAGSMDLAEAATTVAQALNLFSLKGEDASHVADAFATAANKTTADVGFFAMGLAQGGAAAKAAGLNFDETTAALEIMAANGFKSGSDAGTSLKTALIQLAHPTKKAQQVTKDLGLEFFKSNGEMKSLGGISTMLRDKFDGLSRKQRLAAAATLVGTDGMRALLALYDQGPGKIRQFERGLQAQGTASDVANAKMDNLKGSWQKLVAQLQTMAIKVGTAMLPSLKSAADGVTRFFDSLNQGNLRATGFGRFVDDVRKMADPLLGVFSTIARGAALALGAASKAPGFGGLKILAREAQLAADGIDGLRDAMNGIGKGSKPKDVKITARLVDQVTPTLIRISGTKLGAKVQKILGDDSSVRQKINALKSLGINGPTARFLAQTGSVEGAIAAIAGRSVTIPVNFKAQPFSSKPPGSASGRPAGTAGVSLVGEGGGPEAIGNLRDGFRMTSGPQLVGLGPEDWVIPTEPRYQGRALTLMASALGIPAFAKGKKPTRKERRAQQDRRITSAETQAGTAGTQMDTAQELQRQSAFEKAKAKKIKLLELERTRLRGALKGAKGSRKTDLRSKLANVQNDLARTRKSVYQPPEVAAGVDVSKGTPLDTNMQRMLDGYDAKIALAELNDNPLDPATLKDNVAPLTEKAGYLQRALAAAQQDPRFGGPSVVASLARDLKSTRDQIAEINQPSSLAATGDQQAQADQQYQRGLAAGQTSFIDRLTAATVQGAAPSLVFQTYVPPSPSEARRLADHVVSGVDFQGGRPASSQRIGV